MAKITSPIEGYTGTTDIGPHRLEFKDGVAQTDGDLSDGVKLYLTSNGYGIGSKAATAPVDDTPEPPDPREYAEPTQVGAKLRDAAVDPQPGDFLAPTNAGQANPHGPDVVSPEIHASQGVRPVKGGDVHVDDSDAQDDAETEHADKATDGTPVVAVEQPAGNASRDAWAEFAKANGATDEELDGKGRDELRDTYSA